MGLPGSPHWITSSRPRTVEEKITDIRKEQRRLSAIPWLNHWLTKLNLASVSSLYLYQAGVTVTLGTLVLTSIAGFAFLGYILYLALRSRAPGAASLGRFSSAAFSLRPAQARQASIQAGTAIARGARHDGQRSPRGPQSDRQPGRRRPGVASRSAERSASVSRNRTTVPTCARRS